MPLSAEGCQVAAQSGMPSVVEKAMPRVVQTLAMGPLARLFGSTGIDGSGTKFEVEHVDPFMLCDYVCLEGTKLRKPPFCAHPHSGTAVATILLEGVPMRAWDNIRGFEEEKIFPGGVYVVRTGAGCVHDEGADPVNLDKACSASFGLPGGDRVAKQFRMFQLWFDCGDIHVDEMPPPRSQVVKPELVPIVSGGAMMLRVLLGNYGEAEGVNVPLTVLHGALQPFSGQGHVQIPAGHQCFIFCMVRGARLSCGDVDYPLNPNEELVVPKQAETLTISVDVAVGNEPESPSAVVNADEALELLIGFGQPSGKPFFKLLGYGGALVANSEDRVRSLMREYEKDPRRFGVLPDSTEHADTSQYGLQEGYKDPLDGRGECQLLDPSAPAPEARWYEIEAGPYQPKGKGKGKS